MTATKSRPSILLLGDSLTQLSFEGWGAKLAHVYQRRADVMNRGYSGYNTRFYLHLPWLQQQGAETADLICLAVIFFGANDAALQDVDPHHHVPVSEYAENLKTLVKRVQTTYPSVGSNILLVAPPPVHHQQRLDYQIQRFGKEKATGVLERKLETTGEYARACVQAAKDLNVASLNLYQLMLDYQPSEGANGDTKGEDVAWAKFFYDGLHFAKPGHDFVAEQMLAAIAQHFPSIAVAADAKTGQWCNSGSTSDLGSAGPYHDEIDHKQTEKSFADYETKAKASTNNKRKHVEVEQKDS